MTSLSEVSSGETPFVSTTLVSNVVLIFSSWVQLSESTSVWSRSEELLLQLYVSRETYADVGAYPEGKKFSFSLLYL